MLQDLKGSLKQALRKLKEGELHISHVGMYTDKVIIVLHKDKLTKEVKVVDNTESQGVDDVTVPPVPPLNMEKIREAILQPDAKKKRRPKLACKHCGKVLKNKGGKTRHENKCLQK